MPKPRKTKPVDTPKPHEVRRAVGSLAAEHPDAPPPKVHAVHLPRWIGAPVFWARDYIKARWGHALLVAGLVSLAFAYEPWTRQQARTAVYAEVCQRAKLNEKLVGYIPMSDAETAFSSAVLETIYLKGYRGQRMLDLPISLNGREIPLREHPAMSGMMKRSRLQEAQGLAVAYDFQIFACDREAPIPPHEKLYRLIVPEDPAPEAQRLMAGENTLPAGGPAGLSPPD